MTEATPEMALRIEADVRLRAGQITETQARSIVRADKVDPLAAMVAQQSQQAHGMAAALRELHSVCLAMDAEQYADDLFELHGSAEQVEAHMESEGHSDEEIFMQLRRLGLRRVYVRETASPQ